METPNGAVPEVAPEVSDQQEKQVKPRKSKAKKQRAAVSKVEVGEAFLIFLDAEQLNLPKDSTDPHWDPRMEVPIEKWLIDSIDDHGVEDPIEVTPAEDGTYNIVAGRTRVRAVLEVNKRRKKGGQPPVKIPAILATRDDVDSMLRAVRENAHRVETDPLTMARTMARLHDVGMTEGEIAAQFRIPVSAVPQYFAVLAMPEKIQKMAAERRVSVAALAELAKLKPGEIDAKVDALIAAAATTSGGKLTAKTAKRAAGTSDEPDRLNAKAIKTLIDELKEHAKTEIGAKEALVVQGAIYSLETVLDARKRDGLLGKLAKAAH